MTVRDATTPTNRLRVAIVAAALLLLIAVPGRATPGSTWLELGPGARASALGEAMTASAHGATASYWNPAAVGLGGHSLEAMLADSWVDGGTVQYAAGSFQVGRYGVGLSAHYVGVGDIDLRDRPSAAPIGQYDARNLALGGVVSMETWYGVRVGLGAKYLDEQIYVYDATGWAVDLGLLRQGLLNDRLDLGLAARHLGQMGELRDSSEELPMTVAAGARWRFPVIDGNYSPAFMLDVSKVSGYDVRVHGALEVGILGYLTGRVGYMSGHEGRHISAGFGVAWKGIRFDFAYVPYVDDLGNETRYSLGMDW